MNKAHKIIVLLLIIATSSCATKKDVLYFQDVDSLDSKSLNFSNPTIQPNDILKISIGTLMPEAAIPYNKSGSNGQGNMNLEIMKLDGYVVDSNYNVTLPILGEISAKGKTTQELSAAIKKILEDGKHLVSPTVNVRFLNAKFTVLGEVGRPGTYNFTEERLTLIQALGLAGDLTINGKRQDVVLIREIDNNRQVFHIDLTQTDWVTSEAYFIKPNDFIKVDPNIKTVKSSGIIGNPQALLGMASVIVSLTILITRL